MTTNQGHVYVKNKAMTANYRHFKTKPKVYVCSLCGIKKFERNTGVIFYIDQVLKEVEPECKTI